LKCFHIPLSSPIERYTIWLFLVCYRCAQPSLQSIWEILWRKDTPSPRQLPATDLLWCTFSLVHIRWGCFFFFEAGASPWTQALMLARQVLYHLSHSASPGESAF
jgi:hypothetical protein